MSGQACSFDPSLLDTSRGLLTAPGDLYATLNAHGLYNSMRFVVRLSPEVHRTLSEFPGGVHAASGVGWEAIQAFSTYLHETIHWWQHIGSTTGLLLSLSYPAETHTNFNHLRRLLAEIGPKKPLRTYAEHNHSHGGLRTPGDYATVVVNNFYDIGLFRFLITNPERGQQAVSNPYFDCVGHAYHIAYSRIILNAASTFDEGLSVLPNPIPWDGEFQALREAKEEGYYFGSPVRLSPIGAYSIFEGQARFAQLQYLYFSSGGRLNWDDAKAFGMLGDTYIKAFNAFLKMAELDWPPSIDHSTVALFLLVCDMAVNPGKGFPFPLLSPQTFIKDTDPGMRFLFLSRTVATKCRDTVQLIRAYSREEYAEVSERLAEALITWSPLTICGEIVRWSKEGAKFRELMERHAAADCGAVNVPIQFLFGHYLAFAADKLHCPEFFCWPGALMAGDRLRPNSSDLFARHSPRFIDRADDETIVPILRDGTDEKTIMETFHQFYGAHVVYDLTRQWINEEGPFRYDYRWLQPAGTDEEIKAWSDRNFAAAYGVMPDKFEIIA